MSERTPESLAQAARALLASKPDRGATRRYAEGFDWGATTAGQLDLFGRIVSARTAAGAGPGPRTEL